MTEYLTRMVFLGTFVLPAKSCHQESDTWFGEINANPGKMKWKIMRKKLFLLIFAACVFFEGTNHTVLSEKKDQTMSLTLITETCCMDTTLI